MWVEHSTRATVTHAIRTSGVRGVGVWRGPGLSASRSKIDDLEEHVMTDRTRPIQEHDVPDPDGLVGVWPIWPTEAVERDRLAGQRTRDRIMGALCGGTLGFGGLAVLTDSPDASRLIFTFAGLAAAYFIGEKWGGGGSRE